MKSSNHGVLSASLCSPQTPNVMCLKRPKMKKGIIITLIFYILSGCVSLSGPKELVHIGTISRDCKEVRAKGKAPFVTVPLNFIFSPEKAAVNLPDGCGAKFFYQVYADLDNYYFLNSDMVFIKRDDYTIKNNSYVINGETGKLVSKPKYIK